ncbi:hypothetical protein LA345_38735 (plasmid) [Burkholderia vietnamiensis]|uniref:Uncharacterized protein n=1 Tax=Burkholderia vietnamiensis (strain G4 / LMG 22486) TaxID=269482 RepID=A4JWB0_BURVG|nr:hypothetical protein Bcep1808_7693 [Burkholderia vietnamiensis G4]MCB4349735.1 hypothetical protein [Burkholderia vietnamiensis]
MSEQTFEVSKRLEKAGGGWNVKFYRDGIEMGGGAFPADPHRDPHAGMYWWNGLAESDRAEWMKRAGDTGKAVDAWAAYLDSEAHAAALGAGEEWVGGTLDAGELREREPFDALRERITQLMRDAEALGLSCASFFRSPGSARGPVAYVLIGETAEDVEQARADKR